MFPVLPLLHKQLTFFLYLKLVLLDIVSEFVLNLAKHVMDLVRLFKLFYFHSAGLREHAFIYNIFIINIYLQIIYSTETNLKFIVWIFIKHIKKQKIILVLVNILRLKNLFSSSISNKSLIHSISSQYWKKEEKIILWFV